MQEKLILLMGVSGSGKTTILTEILKTHSQLLLVPSYTTRPMRSNEKNGRKYRHISKEEFEKGIENGEFLEYAIVHKKHYYGTKLSQVKQSFKKGLVPITEVDMHGFEKIKKDSKGINFVSIFFDLPSDVMIERIKKRGNVEQEEVNRRLNSAKEERVKAKKLCNYFFSTDDTIKNNIKNVNKIIKEILNEK